MGKSKKPFIDKKKSSTYHVLHRSQRDVGGDGSSQVVLWPSPDNLEETNDRVLSSSTDNVLQEWKKQAAEVGLLQEYNYDKHLKPITGSGDFFDASGTKRDVSALGDARSRLLIDEDEVKEVSRQLESIALTPDCMDDDVAQALFGDYDEGDFEEILDDFVLTAAQEPNDKDEQQEVFDFDAHIQELMERAKKQEQDEAVLFVKDHAWAQQDDEFFSKAKALHQKDHDDDDDSGHFDESCLDGMLFDTPGVVPALQADEERALCERFEQTLAEYDSDEVGDLDEECEDIRGARPLEGDTQVDAALDDFLQEKEDQVFMEGVENRRTGGSGFSVLVRKHMVPAEHLTGDMNNEEAVEPVEEVIAKANEVLAGPELEPPPEEVLIDGKSYFSERKVNPWDCESILTTYSNLDNNPAVIGNQRRRKKKKNSKISPESVPEQEPVQIRLSNKTGLPLGVLSQRGESGDDCNDTFVSVNKGMARKTNETAEEKKTRKNAVKKERQMARMQKKMMKEAFKEEFIRRSDEVVADDVGGKSVFRYS